MGPFKDLLFRLIIKEFMGKRCDQELISFKDKSIKMHF